MERVTQSVDYVLSRALSQTIEFPDDELVEPLEGLDISEDGVEPPPPPAAPDKDTETAPAKPNLLVSRRGLQNKYVNVTSVAQVRRTACVGSLWLYLMMCTPLVDVRFA